jgi:phosphatidate cytidylyltransferase
MTKPRSVKFQHREKMNGSKQLSTSSSNESTADGGSPTRNGNAMMDKTIGHTNEKPEASEYEKKKASFITRAIWTLLMIGGFFAAMLAGHVYILIIVTAVQIICFKEVIAIAQVPARQKNLPLTKSLNWYYLAITMYFLYGESVVYYFKHILLVDAILLPFATHHRFISFMLYILGKSDNVRKYHDTDVNHRLRLLCRFAEEG